MLTAMTGFRMTWLVVCFTVYRFNASQHKDYHTRLLLIRSDLRDLNFESYFDITS